MSRAIIVNHIKNVIDPSERDSARRRIGPFTGLIADPNGDFDMQVRNNRMNAEGPDMLVRTILPSSTDPANLTSEQLPGLLYAYGTTANNEAAAAGSQNRGETLTFLLNVTFEKFIDDEFLIDTAAYMNDAIDWLIPNLPVGITPAVSIGDARLASVVAFSQGLSDREFLQFAIEIDWSYPLINLGNLP